MKNCRFLATSLLVILSLFPLYAVHASESVIMKSKFDFDESVIVTDANVRAMLVNDNAKSGLSLLGTFNGNSAENIAKRGLRIEAQRQAWDVIVKAVIENNLADAELGLKALEWGFSPSVAGADGSWPLQQNEPSPSMYTIHNKSVFLYAATRSLHLLKTTRFHGVPADEISKFKERVDSLILSAAKSARWMASSDNTNDFFNNANLKNKQTNQLLSVAMALMEAGTLAHDKALIDAGKVRMDDSLKLVTSNGTFPEGSGNPNGYIFDSGYQTVSLEIFARYIATLQDTTYKNDLLVLLQKGVDRFLQVVGPDGSIDTSKNSRTEACGARVSGHAISKGHSIDVFPYRLRYLGLLLGKSSEYNVIADTIMDYGQGYDHIGCGQ